MATKLVEKIYNAAPPHYVGDGFRVHNFIPSLAGLEMQRTDPFIMLDYNAPFVLGLQKNQEGWECIRIEVLKL
jgi:quercetin 2,3-dioxygenase